MEPKIAGCLNGRYENSLQLIVEIHRQTVSVPERKSCPPLHPQHSTLEGFKAINSFIPARDDVVG